MDAIKRYALFAGSSYYPWGGWDDFKKSSDDLEELKIKVPIYRSDYDWWHVIDLQTGKKVASDGKGE